MSLLDSVLEVSGQREGERGERAAGDRHVGTSDRAQTARLERVPDGDVAVDGQQHGQPDTQQS